MNTSNLLSAGILEDKLARYYTDIDPQPYRRLLGEAIATYTGTRFARILDIGSGSGAFIKAVQAYGFDVQGLEASDFGLKSCSAENLNVSQFFLAAGNPIPFASNTMSMVLMNQVIEHLEKAAGQYYIREIIRVLEPGGVAIIQSPARHCRIWRTDPHHIYCWQPNELREEVRRHGSIVENIRLERGVLELWMLFSYNECIIDTWHKYIKYPRLKRIGELLAKGADRLIFKPLDMDYALAVANVSFSKAIRQPDLT